MPQVCKLLSSLASGRTIVLYKLHKLLNAKRTDDMELYRGADKSLVRPTSRCILFDG